MIALLFFLALSKRVSKIKSEGGYVPYEDQPEAPAAEVRLSLGCFFILLCAVVILAIYKIGHART